MKTFVIRITRNSLISQQGADLCKPGGKLRETTASSCDAEAGCQPIRLYKGPDAFIEASVLLIGPPQEQFVWLGTSASMPKIQSHANDVHCSWHMQCMPTVWRNLSWSPIKNTKHRTRDREESRCRGPTRGAVSGQLDGTRQKGGECRSAAQHLWSQLCTPQRERQMTDPGNSFCLRRRRGWMQNFRSIRPSLMAWRQTRGNLDFIPTLIPIFISVTNKSRIGATI